MSAMTVEDQIEMLKHQIASDKQELARLEAEIRERTTPQAPARTVKMVRIDFVKEGQARFLVLFPRGNANEWLYTYDNGRGFRKSWTLMLAGVIGTPTPHGVTFKSMTIVDENNIVTVKTYENR